MVARFAFCYGRGHLTNPMRRKYRWNVLKGEVVCPKLIEYEIPRTQEIEWYGQIALPFLRSVDDTGVVLRYRSIETGFQIQ